MGNQDLLFALSRLECSLDRNGYKVIKKSASGWIIDLHPDKQKLFRNATKSIAFPVVYPNLFTFCLDDKNFLFNTDLSYLDLVFCNGKTGEIHILDRKDFLEWIDSNLSKVEVFISKEGAITGKMTNRQIKALSVDSYQDSERCKFSFTNYQYS